MKNLEQYRIRFRTDDDYEFEECDGLPMPMSPARYKGNEFYADDGARMIPHAEYLRYYGDPDCHVVVGMVLEKQCECCGTWKAAESLWGIDFMADSPEAARMEIDGVMPLVDVLAVPDYLAEVARDLLNEVTA